MPYPISLKKMGNDYVFDGDVHPLKVTLDKAIKMN